MIFPQSYSVIKPPFGAQPNHSHLSMPDLGLWVVNEGAGTKLIDSTLNKRNGTINGGNWVAGPDGWVLDLVGASKHYVSVPNIIELEAGGDVTFSIWVFFKDLSGFQHLMNQWLAGQGLFFISNGTRIRWQEGTSLIQSGAGVLSTSTWLNLVATKIGATGIVYRNGFSVLSGTVNGASTSGGTVPFGIGGADGVGGTQSLNAIVGDVRVFNRGLSPKEVLENFNTLYPMFTQQGIPMGFSVSDGVKIPVFDHYYRQTRNMN